MCTLLEICLQVSQGGLPPDVSITTGPCTSAQVGQPTTLSFNVTSDGLGTAPTVGVVLEYTQNMNLLDIVAVDPTGAGESAQRGRQHVEVFFSVCVCVRMTCLRG